MFLLDAANSAPLVRDINTGFVSSDFWNQNIAVYILCFIGVLALAYFLGSINTAIIVSRTLYHEDIRTKGSGNAGMTNMLRTYGAKAALLTLVGDLLKTLIPALVCGCLFGFRYFFGISFCEEMYMAGLFTVLGHIFPVYYKFKGGKGVLATASLALIASPIVFLILFLLFVLIVWWSRYVSLGSVLVAVLYPVCIHGHCTILNQGVPLFTAIATIFLAIIIVWAHRHNLDRITNRTENKLSFGKKKSDDGE